MTHARTSGPARRALFLAAWAGRDGFYERLLDTREWPEFMRAGREAMLSSLRQHALRAAA